ncbi:prephenate dehydrogenase [Lentilactobacillus hilgardii]|uniref:Prephenate dehydrogenase n=1 Tax=Lentilactobacillus hilgardii (strain ATCC 8290 / DSM 20176 / CCUG 30140 / JCM 1155 / KCTC 3500 / NBRC 15886 / NCIMB 8040 / NRRL B-1843 / 9) TaxID=1423757 RepID=C0XJ34_LENH9|nr:prephenate dehydrogenase/arogenate dehydrogenase family protein [Lentilactobacillus hilgardii]EEI24613.1 prephenate dehydrogenase [Lentilactobacillus hilgardii DSM 20176 = ATCC 8290]KRK57318.1 prephenate dehydrogenase [Lentilactobacillus hilgardii DSM 20176 = ATCC 8290]MCP9332957.1 prephenate dehydrogenase/arogenate dehydrogenase family protein [Lentilactobacillus hilgardii]MCP9349584.1 prephenate dehydrogenase/arogenate dehydrogenase family protein [Lentilactobacillus hilgardii]MCP9352452.
MTTVLISGLGLIGSSIARVIKQENSEIEIIGSDPDDESAQFLLEHHLIDDRQVFTNAVPLADFIILAGPVSVVIRQINELITLPLKPDVFVTDVGSTKEAIMDAAKPLISEGVNFVGGHPMAGSDKSGSRSGKLDLFDHAVYFVVGGTTANPKLVQFQNLLSAAHLRWQVISASLHDQLVSEISHVPHVIAVTLVNTIADDLSRNPDALKAAAGGFRDTTRIAASDPTMWTAIMMSNAELINHELSKFQQHLSHFQTALEARDEEEIKNIFKNAQAVRKSLDERK